MGASRISPMKTTNTRHLTLFTEPSILKTIGPIRVARFFEGFAEDLKAGNPALLATIKLEPGSYEPIVDFAALADVLACPQSLPDRLHVALLTLEAAAS